MSDGTKIEWTDATVNAVNGCSVLSPGCKRCYAMKQAHRFEARRGLTHMTAGGMVWTGEVRLNEKQLLQPLRWTRPRRIFWNAHGDLFHDSVPDEWIDRCFAVMAMSPQHTHQVLTKRSARMRRYFEACPQPRWMAWMKRLAQDFPRPNIVHPTSGGMILHTTNMALPSVWLGVSVEDQQRADERIPDLLAAPAAVRFLSCEPLLGPINVIDAMWAGTGEAAADLHATIDWIIAGGESGPGARPMHPDWARSLRDQCAAAGVPFFFKQWGEWQPDLTRAALRPEDAGQLQRHTIVSSTCRKEVGATVYYAMPARILERGVGEAERIRRVGKKVAGRLLDGVEHNGMPV